MKKYLKYIIIGLITITTITGISGCKKDWLKPEPLSFYEPNLTYVDAGAMQAALVACARNLRLEYYGDNPETGGLHQIAYHHHSHPLF